jgi:trimeric autotransporter adhesin
MNAVTFSRAIKHTCARLHIGTTTLLAMLTTTLALLSAGASAQVIVAGSVGGVNGSYTTLGAAFNAINAVAAHTGSNITLAITGNTNEGTATATLNQPSGGSWTTLTISPSGGAARTITGATTAGSPLIDFNGADNVTINGLNTGGNSLTIANTTVSVTTGTSTIRFINGATGNTITNTTVQGSGTAGATTGNGTILFSTDINTATGNDNNTIANNFIGPAGANLPSVAISCAGGLANQAVGNSGLVIDNNNIFDYFNTADSSAGVTTNSGCNNFSITNNRFYQSALRTWTAGTPVRAHSAIFLRGTTAAAGVQGMTITGNIIGFASSTQTGTYALSGGNAAAGKFVGISFSGIPGGAVSNISNNTIAAVSLTDVTSSGTGFGAPLMGIYISSGPANTNGNMIGSQSSINSITYSSSSGTDTSDVYGIYNLSLDTTVANGNMIGGITASNFIGASNIYGLKVNTLDSVTSTLTGNTVGGTVANSIQSTSTANASQVVGIELRASMATVHQNTVRNLSASGGTNSGPGASVIGLNFLNAGINTVTENTIFNLRNSNLTAATKLTGIRFTVGGAANLVARNLIYGISSASTSASAEISGIKTLSGATVYRNNMIAVGAGTANAIGSGAAAAGVVGIYEVGGVNSFFHNSVYVGGTPTAGAGASFAFNSDVASNSRSVRNNIFFNARSSSGTATGKNYAVRVGGTTANPPGLSLDNNLYFANGGGAEFGFFNGLDVASFAAWKTAVGLDVSSLQGDPKYVDPTNAMPNLHINPTAFSAAEGNGADIGVIDDFDGQTRASFTPVDIGADAGNFVGGDLVAPTIIYTPLANTSLTSNRVLSVAMADLTGVGTGGSAPRVYYKKNAGVDVSQPCSLASGTAQNGTWNCTINYASVGGVVPTDVIRYYVVVQDTLGNLAASPSSGLVGSSVNTVTSPPTTPNLYTILPTFSGSINVGATEAITSLTNAGGLFERINAGALIGNVVVNLTSDLTAELGAVALNEWPEDGVGNYTLLIKPSGGPRTISGANAGALIRLNGADRVTIDGSTTGATASGVGGNAALRELTIQNTDVSAAAAVILVGSGSNGAQNNTIRNVNVLGQDPLTTLIGISLGGATADSFGTDNDNNRIENCSIKRAIIGIFSGGASVVNPNTGTVITMNETSSVFGERIRRVGILAVNENGIQITQNSINGISTDESEDAIGIAVGASSIDATTVIPRGVTNALVARNKIDGVAGLNTTGFSAAGIAVAGDAGGANIIVNNMITGVTSPATSPDLVAGIFVAGVTGSVTRLHHNSIAMTGNRGPVGAQSPSYAVAITGANPTVALKNNIFYTTQIASSGGANAKSYAIGMASGSFANLDSNYNNFFASGANAGFFRSGSLAPAAGTDYGTLALWRTATAKDGNSLEVDPIYLNPLSNLHLNGATSPLLSAGITGFATVDFDNEARPAANPAIGADQLLSDLTLSKAHVGANFTQGQNGAQYVLTVTNGGAVATSGTLTVTDTLPAGLSFASGIGTGWSCSALLQVVTCTNPSTPIAGGGNSLITLTVNVAANAAASLQNFATVACTCAESNTANNTSNTDTVNVVQLPDLTVTKTHTGNFVQGQVGANYTVTVSNTGSTSKPAASLVTLTDTPPAGLTLTAMSGAGWSCTLPACTRSDALASGQSYPPITVTVSVLGSATSPQINAATVSTAAAESNTTNNSASDSTIIVAGTPGTLTVSKTGSGSGTVTSADGGINCGATCASVYANTSIITLTATPTGGAVFTGWLGACIGTGTCTVTISGAKAVSATFAASPVGPRILDINNDNAYLPESDGVLVLRYLFGLRGAALTNGLSLTGSRTDPTQIETYLRDILPYLDVDGNGVVDALTDGLLILRHLATSAGPLLVQNATGLGATRSTAIDVRNYILTLTP